VEKYEDVLVILSKTMETVMDFMCCEEGCESIICCESSVAHL
jgi:hypothetical protein